MKILLLSLFALRSRAEPPSLSLLRDDSSTNLTRHKTQETLSNERGARNDLTVKRPAEGMLETLFSRFAPRKGDMMERVAPSLGHYFGASWMNPHLVTLDPHGLHTDGVERNPNGERCVFIPEESQLTLQHYQDAHQYKLEDVTLWKEQLRPNVADQYLSPDPASGSGLLGYLSVSKKLYHYFVVCRFSLKGKPDLHVRAERSNFAITLTVARDADSVAGDSLSAIRLGDYRRMPGELGTCRAACRKNFGFMSSTNVRVDHDSVFPASQNNPSTLADLLNLCASQAKTNLRYNVLSRNCQHFSKLVIDSFTEFTMELPRLYDFEGFFDGLLGLDLTELLTDQSSRRRWQRTVKDIRPNGNQRRNLVTM